MKSIFRKNKGKRMLPFFEKVFSWGLMKSYNDVDLEHKYSLEDAEKYCKK